MTLNFKKQTVFRSHASQAVIATDSDSKPIANAVYEITGSTSKDTKVLDNRIIIAKDEKAKEITLTVKSGIESEKVILNVTDTKGNDDGFDDNNVILTFGLTSDTHVSGSWNQPRSVEKWVHCIKAMQNAAGRNADGSTKLDAFTCTGDFVDAVNSFGNVNGSAEQYGCKGAQNYREVSFLRSGLEGRETNNAAKAADGAPAMKADFGKGLEKGVKFFYCLGNHDESGRGMSNENEKYTRVYTAKYFVAVMCGWEYSSAKGVGTPDLCDSSYIEYAEDLVKIHNCSDGEKAALTEAFTAKHGTDGKYAYERFCAYYGDDTEYSADELGLFFGNRHAVINGIHFIAIEVSQCEKSAEYLDKWCAKSVSEDERKPIIVLTHEKVYHTIDASIPGHTKLLGVLAKYPQIFVWTGHTHSVLTNANAIMSDCGFTAVEGSVLAYLSCEGVVGRGDIPAGNYCKKEEHDSGPCCLVRVDKNYNVKIDKIDVHRSYKESFGTENNAVYFGEPWIISGISSSGEHLLKYGIERSFDENNPAPYFDADAKVTLSRGEDGRLYVNFPAAKKDGCENVKYYKVQLENLDDPSDRPWQFATSFAFRFKNQAELLENYPEYSIGFPAQKENRVSANLDKCVELSTPCAGARYRAYVTAYDSWGKASATIVS